jgi:hypothetical protein
MSELGQSRHLYGVVSLTPDRHRNRGRTGIPASCQLETQAPAAKHEAKNTPRSIILSARAIDPHHDLSVLNGHLLPVEV